MTTRDFEIPIERVFEILVSYSADDVQLRLHLSNAQRQTLAEVQLLRITELENELRVRLEQDANEGDPELAAVPDEPESEEPDDDAEDPTG